MKVIIAGSRHMLYNPELMQRAITLSGFSISEVVCGLAPGADSYGKKWAYLNKIPVSKFPAEWEKYGNKAGPIRNQQMADYADALIDFIWDNSRGSLDMLTRMEKINKPCYVVYNGKIE